MKFVKLFKSFFKKVFYKKKFWFLTDSEPGSVGKQPLKRPFPGSESVNVPCEAKSGTPPVLAISRDTDGLRVLGGVSTAYCVLKISSFVARHLPSMPG